MLPPSDASFILGLKHPVVSGAEIILEGTKHCRSSMSLGYSVKGISAPGLDNLVAYSIFGLQPFANFASLVASNLERLSSLLSMS